MTSRSLRPVLVLLASAIVVATGAAAGHATRPAGAPEALAQGIPGKGSIVYVRKGDLYLTSPDGTKTRRVTTNGASATADHSGGPGYLSPSQTDSGTIVAIRNQKGAKGYNTGWLWVMDRHGRVIRKFAPPQDSYSTFGSVLCSPVPYRYQPYGLYRAIVSPDGSKIAYVEHGTWQDPGCGLSTVWSTFVVGIKGGKAQRVRQSNSNLWDLEAGSWASSTRLVLDKLSSADELLLQADAPTYVAKTWWGKAGNAGSDFAVATPIVRHGIVATTGASNYQTGEPKVLRLWTISGTPPQPHPHCENTATGGGSTAQAYAPSVAPDGTGVTWFEQGTAATEVRGEGVYVMRLHLATSCPSGKVLLVQGGYSPFWGPAAV
jgi:hypothetical protein